MPRDGASGAAHSGAGHRPGPPPKLQVRRRTDRKIRGGRRRSSVGTLHREAVWPPRVPDICQHRFMVDSSRPAPPAPRPEIRASYQVWRGHGVCPRRFVPGVASEVRLGALLGRVEERDAHHLGVDDTVLGEQHVGAGASPPVRPRHDREGDIRPDVWGPEGAGDVAHVVAGVEVLDQVEVLVVPGDRFASDLQTNKALLDPVFLDPGQCVFTDEVCSCSDPPASRAGLHRDCSRCPNPGHRTGFRPPGAGCDWER